MRKSRKLKFLVTCLFILLAAGCGAPPPDLLTPLSVKVTYPLEETSILMGNSLKAIVEVHDEDGRVAANADVKLTIFDPAGKEVGVVAAPMGRGDVYRSEAWPIPHRSTPGTWKLEALASLPGEVGHATTSFQVANSISEDLLEKYGFWIDEPSLGYLDTFLMREVGDAENGDVFWGGFFTQLHVFRESRVELYWRKGRFPLDSAQEVRSFLLNDVGNLGFIPLRELGEFRPVRFGEWDAWQGTARGRLRQYDDEFVVFYAPEVDKTFALGTHVVLPPTGIEPHSTLRDSFEVHPEVNAQGKAPEPLKRLLPPPEMISPALGTRYVGDVGPIVFKWKPVKELAEDEYYRVKIDYDYAELNTSLYYTTTATEFTLPPELYAVPNCGVFNWQVTLMRQTGVRENGDLIGDALSYDSLHWYVEWLYPLDVDPPFLPHCQNPQT